MTVRFDYFFFYLWHVIVSISASATDTGASVIEYQIPRALCKLENQRKNNRRRCGKGKRGGGGGGGIEIMSRPLR